MSDAEFRNLMTGLLYDKDINMLLAVIEASVNNTMEPEEEEKRQKLYDYFSDNKDGLVPSLSARQNDTAG